MSNLGQDIQQLADIADEAGIESMGEWCATPGQDKRNIIQQLLSTVIGQAPRPGIAETPDRVVKAWAEWTAGYHVDISALLKVFEDGAEKADEMVIVKDIPIYSKCEHHLADIFGTATIAYIPNGKIVGLSKLSRLADAFARRLQVQERLTNQIVDALMEHLQPKGAACVIKARHMCMESRGMRQQGHHTITSALRGVLKSDPAARAEFMAFVNTPHGC
jgi:GTP cyclohydrolase I